MNPVRFLHKLRVTSGGGLGGELLRGGVGSGAMRIAEIVLGVAAAMLLARQLGVAGLGFYSVAVAAVALASLPIELGFPVLVTREAARAHALGDDGGARAVLAFTSRMILVFSAVLGLAAAVLWATLRDRYPPELVETVLATLAIPPLVALGNVRAAALRSLRKPLLGTAADSVVRPGAFVLMLGAAALLAPGWLSPARAAALKAASAALALAFVAAALARHAPPMPAERAGPSDTAIPRRAWIIAAFSLGLLRGLRVAQPQILLLALGAFGSVDAAGLFRIAQRGASLGNFGFNTVAVLISPYLARLDAAGQRDRMQRLITVSAWAITVPAVAACLLFLLAGRLLLNLLFGPDFEAAYPALAVLGVTLVATSVLGPAQIILVMMHREGNVTAAAAGALVVSAGLCAVLAPSYGALGAAVASAIGMIGVSVLLWRRTKTLLGLRCSIFGA